MHCFPPILVQGYAKALQLQLWENQTSNLGAARRQLPAPPTQDFSLWKCV